MVRAGMPDYVGLDGTGVIAGDDRQSLQAGRVAGHEKPLKRGREGSETHAGHAEGKKT